MSFDAEWIRMTLLMLPPLLLSLTVHEFAHARMALAFGDPTAKAMGRVTLNPLRHLDPVGTLVLIFSGFIGWAKPVPVNPNNLHPRRLGDIAVSLAGPLSNLLLAIVAGLLLRGWIAWGDPASGLWENGYQLLTRTLIVNICLCVFNLIPLFPLDGHHVLREILPARNRQDFMHWQMRYGMFMLMGLIFAPRLVDVLSQGKMYFNPLGDVLGFIFKHVLAPLGL